MSKMNDNNDFTVIPCTGYYGKIPSKGDFVSKGLPRNFTDPWHFWITEALASSKKQLGDTWREHYLTAPLYQYVLSKNLCGNQLWIGVVIPSIDRVGRTYPMTICRTVPSTANPFTLFDNYTSWFDRAEVLLLSCLDESFSLDELEISLSQLNTDDDDKDITVTLQQFTMHKHADTAWHLPFFSSEIQNRMYPTLLNSMLSTFFSSYSLWKTQGSEFITPSIVISEGLPTHEGVAAFIDGKWKQWGWNDEHIIQ